VSAQVDTAAATAEPSPKGPYALWSYATAYIVIGALIRLLWRVTLLHKERVPGQGAVIVAANHRSFMDPPIVGLGLPLSRPTQFMAKAEMFEKQPAKGFLSSMMAFPVHRDVADRNAIKRALAILSANGVLGMFPEGTRVKTGETGTAQLGVAFIAMKAKAPIVPVGVAGTDQIKPKGSKRPHFPRVTVAYGEPIDPADFAELPREERLAALTKAIMDGIEACMAEAEAYKRSR
jgi:1-acyl-sn-glycerol-3-phosphate acyltransferase